MPPMTLLGRKWQFASDDTPVPCTIGMLFQGGFSLFLLSAIVTRIVGDGGGDVTTAPCSGSRVVLVGMLGLTVCSVASAVLHACTLCEGLRGTVFEEAKRKRVPALLVAQLGVYVCEVLCLLLCTVYIPVVTAECAHDDPVPGELDDMRIFVAFVSVTWGVLLTQLLTVWVVTVLSGLVFMRSTNRINLITERVMQSLKHDKTMAGHVSDSVHELETHMLRFLQQFVPSDLALGLFLLSVRQARDKRRISFKRCHTHTNWVEPETLREATWACRYAMAVYGAPMFAWAKRAQFGACQLCCGNCCGACRRQYPGSTVQGSRALHPLHRESILRLCHLDSADLLFVSHTNTVGGLLPYFLARDAAHRSVVLSIRGTFSIRDVYTDLILTLAPIEDHSKPDPNLLNTRCSELRVHAGVLSSARAIVRDLEARGLLTRLWSALDEEGLRLEVVGHSLGASVAVTVAWLLRPHFANVHCWAVDPPGLTCNAPFAACTEQFCTAVQFADSWVPRFDGMRSLRKLLADTHEALQLAARPKAVLLASTLLSFVLGGLHCLVPGRCAQYWSSTATFLRADSYLLHPALQNLDGLERVAAESVHQEVATFPPGRLFHVTRADALAGGGFAGTRPRQSTHQYVASWVTASDVLKDGFKVSLDMVTDHFPDNILRGLAAAAEWHSQAHGDDSFHLHVGEDAEREDRALTALEQSGDV